MPKYMFKKFKQKLGLIKKKHFQLYNKTLNINIRQSSQTKLYSQKTKEISCSQTGTGCRTGDGSVSMVSPAS